MYTALNRGVQHPYFRFNPLQPASTPLPFLLSFQPLCLPDLLSIQSNPRLLSARFLSLAFERRKNAHHFALTPPVPLNYRHFCSPSTFFFFFFFFFTLPHTSSSTLVLLVSYTFTIFTPLPQLFIVLFYKNDLLFNPFRP
ncbi:MAG: hypothetical protein JOS17DRAFT_29122 [Linnemannia elongata]|nr:MAG: hypothetical protein JOS17DRAFT_29122 [Linnemannia elongata]